MTLRRENLDGVLRDDTRAASASTRQQRIRMLLVSAGIALAVVLLTGAGLMLRSFWRMNTFPQGFKPDSLIAIKLSLSGGKYHRNWPLQDTYIRDFSNAWSACLASRQPASIADR